MASQLIAGSVLLIMTYLIVANADKWFPAVGPVGQMFTNLIYTFQGRGS